MRFLAFTLIAASALLIPSCGEKKAIPMKSWSELPVAHHFSRNVEQDAGEENEAFVRELFAKELANPQLQSMEKPFFVRGVFSFGNPRTYYTWICRVPVTGQLEVLLENRVAIE